MTLLDLQNKKTRLQKQIANVQRSLESCERNIAALDTKELFISKHAFKRFNERTEYKTVEQIKEFLWQGGIYDKYIKYGQGRYLVEGTLMVVIIHENHLSTVYSLTCPFESLEVLQAYMNTWIDLRVQLAHGQDITLPTFYKFKKQFYKNKMS